MSLELSKSMEVIDHFYAIFFGQEPFSKTNCVLKEPSFGTKVLRGIIFTEAVVQKVGVLESEDTGLNSRSTMSKLFIYHFRTQQPSLTPCCPKSGIRTLHILIQKPIQQGPTLSSQPRLLSFPQMPSPSLLSSNQPPPLNWNTQTRLYIWYLAFVLLVFYFYPAGCHFLYEGFQDQ